MQVYQIPINAANKETTKQGTDDFPLAVYHTVLSKNMLGYVPLHWNEEVQFCLVTRGNVLFTVNGEKKLLAQGEGIFINSGRLHMARPVNDPASAYICLDIGLTLLQGFPGSATSLGQIAAGACLDRAGHTAGRTGVASPYLQRSPAGEGQNLTE